MCTAISLNEKRHLFGRTLDVDRSYGESIVLVPRNHTLVFRHESISQFHPAIIGIGCVRNGMTLYFDAMNESGLYAAGLNFPMSAKYHPVTKGKRNVASFEFITLILSECKTLSEARKLLHNTNITNDSFSDELTPTPLHWMIADKTGTITVESVSDGLKIHENQFGVLTNEPPFEYHTAHMADFMQLTSDYPKNNIVPQLQITPYSRGMGAIGLPGDFSSASRFVRAFFIKSQSEQAPGSDEINRFFHIMDSICVPYGCVKTENSSPMYTRYTSCADTDTFCYHFTTYSSHSIRLASFCSGELDSESITEIPFDSVEISAKL